jgi:hypothetical protein
MARMRRMTGIWAPVDGGVQVGAGVLPVVLLSVLLVYPQCTPSDFPMSSQ